MHAQVPSCWEQQAEGLSVSEPEQLPEEQSSHSMEVSDHEQLPEGQYLVDRLIARRERYGLRVNHVVLPSTSFINVHEQGKATQYLVLWQGWPATHLLSKIATQCKRD